MIIKHYKVDMDDQDIFRISRFLENANETFKRSSVIKNYEELNLFLYIKRNMIAGNGTKFKDLQAFSNKSDVYISNFLKLSVSNGSLIVIPGEVDRRNKIYRLSHHGDEVIREFALKGTKKRGLS